MRRTARLNAATFLTTNEKRDAAGYDHLPGNDEIKRRLIDHTTQLAPST